MDKKTRIPDEARIVYCSYPHGVITKYSKQVLDLLTGASEGDEDVHHLYEQSMIPELFPALLAVDKVTGTVCGVLLYTAVGCPRNDCKFMLPSNDVLCVNRLIVQEGITDQDVTGALYDVFLSLYHKQGKHIVVGLSSKSVTQRGYLQRRGFELLRECGASTGTISIFYLQ